MTKLVWGKEGEGGGGEGGKVGGSIRWRFARRVSDTVKSFGLNRRRGRDEEVEEGREVRRVRQSGRRSEQEKRGAVG